MMEWPIKRWMMCKYGHTHFYSVRETWGAAELGGRVVVASSCSIAQLYCFIKNIYKHFSTDIHTLWLCKHL